ncbi:MAG TPA: sigma-70 family RNA polymerase sigma factor [Actinomycetota bacterium]|nr:sigma-70 family RNA polymerase sigma factor [Actinomycetota bacterium]
MQAPRASAADLELVERLRAHDEAAFMELVDTLTPSMRRVARMFVSSDAVADEVVQETWLGVLQGLDGYEGRASLRTWIFRILVNIGKTRGQRESRSVPFATLAGDDLDEPMFEPTAFDHSGSWSTLPFDWRGMPDERVTGRETLAVIGRAISSLPPMQAEVIRLRDVLGWSSDEVRNALDLTDTNQRVLLHRARAKVRAAVEEHLRSVHT